MAICFRHFVAEQYSLKIDIASAGHMPFELFGDAIHFESTRDLVPYLDVCSMLWNGTETIVKLDSHPDAPIWDHPCDSPNRLKFLRYQLKIVFIFLNYKNSF